LSAVRTHRFFRSPENGTILTYRQGGFFTGNAAATGHRSSPKTIVRRGWNQASFIYRPGGGLTDAFGHSFSDHKEWLRPFFQLLERGSNVLDLGCGCGIPDARLLAERFRVTGVDISDVQIERARALVPGVRFLRADMTAVRFRPETFAGIVCLYALIHLPLDEQRPLITRMYRWLVPGGVLLLTTGEVAYTGEEPDWLGSNAKMYWSHADASTYAEWLIEAGFGIVRRTYVPEGESGHALFLARKAGSLSAPRGTRRLSPR
jgi:SAM-dependent methyltransferase